MPTKQASSDEKDFVGLEVLPCVICGQLKNSNVLLMDRRLKKSLTRHEQGVGFLPHPCDECVENLNPDEDGNLQRIALVGVDPDKSEAVDGELIKPQNAHRTGQIIFLERWAWPHIIDQPCPSTDMAFIPEESMPAIEKRGKEVQEVFGAWFAHLQEHPEDDNGEKFQEFQAELEAKREAAEKDSIGDNGISPEPGCEKDGSELP